MAPVRASALTGGLNAGFVRHGAHPNQSPLGESTKNSHFDNF
jgi:hypothetical protein